MSNKHLDSILTSDDEKNNKECGASLESKPEDLDSNIIPYRSRSKEYYKEILYSKFPRAININ